MLGSLLRRLRSLHLRSLSTSTTTTTTTKTKTKTKITTKKLKKPPTLLPSDSTVQFLTESCNLPLPAAVSAAKTLCLSSLEKPRSVLSLLQSHGLSLPQISTLVTHAPSLIRSSPTSLSPKLRFLSSLLPPSSIHSLLLSSPGLLRRSLHSYLRPAFSLFLSLLPSPDHLLRMAHRDHWILSCNFRGSFAPNIALLLHRSVPPENIGKLLATQPRFFTSQHSVFSEAVDTVQSLGLKHSHMLFLHGVRAMTALSRPARERRMALLRELGWSDEAFKVAFQKAPLFFLVSDEKMRRVMEFLVGVVGMEASAVRASPKLLMYALEKRIKPRFAVMRVLEEEGVVRKGKWREDRTGGSQMFLCTEEVFLHKYVRKHIKEVPELMDVFHGKIGLEALASKKASKGQEAIQS